MSELELEARQVAEDWVSEWLTGLPMPRYEAGVADLTRRIVKLISDEAEGQEAAA